MKFIIVPIIAFSFLLLSFTTHDLEKKDILDGELTLLIPKDFKYIKKEDYIPIYEGDPKVDVYYCNEDRTVEISFLKLSKSLDDFSIFKKFSETAILMGASKTYYNDTISINSAKVYLTEFESTFNDKKTYSKIFFINLKNVTVMGNISCNIEMKEQWSSDITRIFESIELK